MVNEACRGTGESHKEKSDVCTEMKHILHEEIAIHLNVVKQEVVSKKKRVPSITCSLARSALDVDLPHNEHVSL